jgi:hypothetical protein
MTSKPYYETAISEERILDILENLFHEQPDQVALALQVLREMEEEE